MARVAMLSLHTSPLVQPGGGDAGGMNVYVRELAAALAHGGTDATVYVRRWNRDLPTRMTVEPGFEVVHVDAGPIDLAKEQLPGIVDEFADGVRDHLSYEPADVLHANYWLSGVAAHRLKHELDLPLVSTFHTLARVKAETGDLEPQARIDAEADVVACSDIITANSVVEMHELVTHYRADPSRIEVVPPGVDHAFFSPGSRRGARQALGLGDEPVLLFVGRIQPLKGVDVAVEALARLGDRRARMLVIGGSSGVDGDDYTAEIDALIAAHGLADRITMVPPQPHHVLSTYYRAADVTIVPSRSESFGLVALESAACAHPWWHPTSVAYARWSTTAARGFGCPAETPTTTPQPSSAFSAIPASRTDWRAGLPRRHRPTPGPRWRVGCVGSTAISPNGHWSTVLPEHLAGLNAWQV